MRGEKGEVMEGGRGRGNSKTCSSTLHTAKAQLVHSTVGALQCRGLVYVCTRKYTCMNIHIHVHRFSCTHVCVQPNLETAQFLLHLQLNQGHC